MSAPLSRRALLAGAGVGVASLLAPIPASRAGAAIDPPVINNPSGQSQDVWVMGDSIVSGRLLPTPLRDSWVGRLNERIGGATCERVANLGVGGETLLDYPTRGVVGLATSAVAAVVATAVKPRLVVLSVGVNDLMQTTDQAAMNWAYFYLRGSLRAAGAGEVLYTTILPYGHGSAQPEGWLPVLEARRATVNRWMRAQWGPMGLLIDRDGLLEAPGSPYMDARYHVGDGLHPNQWGALVLSHALNLSQLGVAAA